MITLCNRQWGGGEQKLKKKFLLNRETKGIFVSAQTNFAMYVDIRLSSITKL